MPNIKIEYIQQKNPFKPAADSAHPQFLHHLVIDTYLGCSYFCQYCWELNEKLIDYKDKDWISYIGVKTDVLYHLNKLLLNSGEQLAVLMGANTDPYQPQEEKHMLTKMVVETLHQHDWPLIIATKSDLIIRDIELLQDYNKNGSVTVLVSICSLDENFTGRWEGFAPPAKKRLEIIEKLSARNIPVGVSYMPIIPYVNDSDEKMKEIFARAKVAGADFVLPSVLVLNSKRRQPYVDRVRILMEKNYQKNYLLFDKLYGDSAYPDREYCGQIGRRLKELSLKYKMRLHIDPEGEEANDTVCLDDKL